ncbi:pectinesterase inhibitor 10-like [Lactuca sativa]|uniref:pectinesterase inhibitor 10-like n=1 Tax=Lactuca sativa TaxID=4236 RepID=UPI000CD9EFE7|nr:pectinesterase inhibitor 10-like [Lactuca sativa]
MTLKPKAPSSRDSDCVPLDQDDRVEHEKEHNESEDSDPEDSPEVIFTKIVPSPPPSPKYIIMPISISPCPPPVSSQPPTSTPLPPPIFTKKTLSTTTTTSVGPSVNINASDAGPKTSSFTTSTKSPVSPQLHDDSDEDGPITQKELKALNEKPDSILSSSIISSSKVYSEAAVKGMLDTLVKEHACNLDNANKAVENSTQSCLRVAEKVDKLVSETKTFLTEINTVAVNNAATMNDAIVNLNASLRKERESIAQLRADNSAEISAFQKSIFKTF